MSNTQNLELSKRIFKMHWDGYLVMPDQVTERISLKDALSFVVDNRGRTAPTAKSGHVLIATNCISNANLYPTYEKVRYVSQETYDTWFRAHPEPFDIILTNKGSQNGAICLVPAIVDFCIAQDMMALRADKTKIDSLYLFAALRSKQIQSAIKNLNVDGVIPHFKKTDFDKLLLPLPHRTDQERIGEIHFALCSKIELNRRMNETLEAMARALFRDWFVTFGPTRAKMAGAQPYLAPEIWSLFPDRLDEEGNPVGWETQSVINQAEWVNGAAFKNMHFTKAPDALPVIKIAELKAGITQNTKWTNTALGEKYRIKDGELLFSWSGNPDTSIDAFIWTGGDAWLNQHIFAVRSNGTRTPAFLYTMLRWLKPEFSEIARNKQTTGLGHVTKQDLKRMQIHVGSNGLLEQFENMVGPLCARLRSNLIETRTLARTRDMLLPKLMSGEICVRENTKYLENCT